MLTLICREAIKSLNHVNHYSLVLVKMATLIEILTLKIVLMLITVIITDK